MLSGTIRDELKLAPGDEPSEQVDPPEPKECSKWKRFGFINTVFEVLSPAPKALAIGRGDVELLVDSEDHGERLLSGG